MYQSLNLSTMSLLDVAKSTTHSTRLARFRAFLLNSITIRF